MPKRESLAAKQKRQAFFKAIDAVESFERLYGLTKNPLFAWHALHSAREVRMVIPGWVQDYLLNSATNLLSAAARGKVPNQPAVVAAKMGFLGSARGFAEYAKFAPLALMRDAYLLERQKGTGKIDALREAGERYGDRDHRTVKKKLDLLCSALGEELSDVEARYGISSK